MQTISGQATIFLLGCAGNSDHMLSYVIGRKELTVLKNHSLTTDKEHS